MANQSEQQFWKVVGGANSKGLLVRTNQSLKSGEASRRLEIGSVVLQMELVGERMMYRLVSGVGPEQGWISLSLNGKSLAERCERPEGGAKVSAELKDPLYSGKLEVSPVTVHTQFGELKGVARHRPEGSPKAPLAVLMLPGNPVVNGFNCDLPLPLAIDEALGAAGFPVVRFDWDGVGMNSPGNHPPAQAYEVTIPDAMAMFGLALSMGERLIICAWNFSGTMASKMALEKWPNVHAVLSLSFAYKQWEFVQRFMGELPGQALKQEFEDHSKLDIPTIYIFGDRDVHTPYEEVKRIVDARPDAGDNAEIHVISQGDQKLYSVEYFMMKGKEEEVAQICVKWAHNLRQQQVDSMQEKLIGA